MNNLVIIKKYALNYLSKYDSSKMNLKRVIKNKIKRLSLEKRDKFHLYNSIENILSEFESKNLINDKEYAIRKIQIFSQQGKSKIYIQNYLLVKGIEKELISNITNEYESNNLEWELESAKIFARKKRIGKNDKDNYEKNLAKLARAGFSYNICKKILDSL